MPLPPPLNPPELTSSCTSEWAERIREHTGGAHHDNNSSNHQIIISPAIEDEDMDEEERLLQEEVNNFYQLGQQYDREERETVALDKRDEERHRQKMKGLEEKYSNIDQKIKKYKGDISSVSRTIAESVNTNEGLKKENASIHSSIKKCQEEARHTIHPMNGFISEYENNVENTKTDLMVDDLMKRMSELHSFQIENIVLKGHEPPSVNYIPAPTGHKRIRYETTDTDSSDEEDEEIFGKSPPKHSPRPPQLRKLAGADIVSGSRNKNGKRRHAQVDRKTSEGTNESRLTNVSLNTPNGTKQFRANVIIKVRGENFPKSAFPEDYRPKDLVFLPVQVSDVFVARIEGLMNSQNCTVMGLFLINPTDKYEMESELKSDGVYYESLLKHDTITYSAACIPRTSKLFMRITTMLAKVCFDMQTVQEISALIVVAEGDLFRKAKGNLNLNSITTKEYGNTLQREQRRLDKFEQEMKARNPKTWTRYIRLNEIVIDLLIGKEKNYITYIKDHFVNTMLRVDDKGVEIESPTEIEAEIVEKTMEDLQKELLKSEGISAGVIITRYLKNIEPPSPVVSRPRQSSIQSRLHASIQNQNHVLANNQKTTTVDIRILRETTTQDSVEIPADGQNGCTRLKNLLERRNMKILRQFEETYPCTVKIDGNFVIVKAASEVLKRQAHKAMSDLLDALYNLKPSVRDFEVELERILIDYSLIQRNKFVSNGPQPLSGILNRRLYAGESNNDFSKNVKSLV